MNVFKRIFNALYPSNKQKRIDLGYDVPETKSERFARLWLEWYEQRESESESEWIKRLERKQLEYDRLERKQFEYDRLIRMINSETKHVNVFKELFDLMPVNGAIDYNNIPDIDFSIENGGDDIPIVLNGWSLMCYNNLFRFEKTVIDSTLRNNDLSTKPFPRDPNDNFNDNYFDNENLSWKPVYWVNDQSSNKWKKYHAQMHITERRVDTHQPDYCLTITDNDVIRRVLAFRDLLENTLEMKTDINRGGILGKGYRFSIRYKDDYINLYNVPFLFNRSDYVSNNNTLEPAYHGYIGEWDSGNVFLCDVYGNLYKPLVNMIDNPEIKRDEIGDIINPHRLPRRIMNITDLRPVLKVADLPVNEGVV